MSYPDDVKLRHESKQSLLGSFRSPTAKTIAAAELMKELLIESNYENTMAVSITEFHGHLTAKDLFLVAFSGYHPHLSINRNDAAKRLSAKLASEARYWFAEEMDRVYHPMHTTTVGFFQKVFGTTFSAASPVTGAMVDTAIDRFATLFEDPDAYTVMKKNISKQDRKAPLYGVLGSALALRMNLVKQVDVPHVVRKLRGKLAFVRAMTDDQKDAKWTTFFNFVKEVLEPPKIGIATPLGENDFTARAPAVGDADIVGVCKEAVQAWGANALGRYCAEPKAYAAARQVEVDVVFGTQRGEVLGQLAFWYSHQTQSRLFSPPLLIIGPEGNEASASSGGYMAPCTSCRNRSQEMQIGM